MHAICIGIIVQVVWCATVLSNVRHWLVGIQFRYESVCDNSHQELIYVIVRLLDGSSLYFWWLLFLCRMLKFAFFHFLGIFPSKHLFVSIGRASSSVCSPIFNISAVICSFPGVFICFRAFVIPDVIISDMSSAPLFEMSLDDLVGFGRDVYKLS